VILRHHSGNILFGVKYEGDPAAPYDPEELFSADELRDGILTKAFLIDDTKTVVGGEYVWTLVSAPSGDPFPTHELLMPESFGGVLRKTCVIDALTKSTTLDIAPFVMEKLEFVIYPSALPAHDARSVTSVLALFGPNDTYPARTLELDAMSPDAATYEADILSREPVKLRVENQWRLHHGKTQTEKFETADRVVVLK
jgi:hypothetical protein